MSHKETLIVLNPDESANFRDYLKEIAQAASLGTYLLEHGGLTQESANSTLHLIETHLDRAGKLVDYGSAAMKERQELVTSLRTANQRVRELQNFVGSEQSIEGLTAQLRFLGAKIHAWWSGECGMGWVREVHFTQYGGAQVQLGLTFDRLSRLVAKPVTDQQTAEENLARLAAEGYQFTKEGRDNHLLDNDQNRQLLHARIAQHLPSGFVTKFEHLRWAASGGGYAEPPIFYLTEVHVWIRDLKDVQNLPGQISNE